MALTYRGSRVIPIGSKAMPIGILAFLVGYTELRPTPNQPAFLFSNAPALYFDTSTDAILSLPTATRTPPPLALALMNCIAGPLAKSRNTSRITTNSIHMERNTKETIGLARTLGAAWKAM